MIVVDDREFEKPDTRKNPDTSDRNGLWVVRHPGQKSTKIVLFVHGLGGHPTKTWGEFPEYVFRHAPDFDVGFYGYSSTYFSNLIPLVRKPTLALYAETMRGVVWQSLIRNLQYSSVVFVCHSLGGVMTKMLVQQIEDDDVERDEYFKRIHSVFFFGTPHFGSDRVRFLAWRFSPMLAALRANAAGTERTNHFWRYALRFDPKDQRERYKGQVRILVYARAVYSQKDFWVDHWSARGELEPQFTYSIPVSHSRLVKPRSAEDGQVDFFLRQLREIDDMRNWGLRFSP